MAGSSGLSLVPPCLRWYVTVEGFWVLIRRCVGAANRNTNIGMVLPIISLARILIAFISLVRTWTGTGAGVGGSATEIVIGD